MSWCKKCPGWDGEEHGPFYARQRVTAPAEEGGAAGVATGSTARTQGLGLPSVSCPPLLATPARNPVFILAEKKDLEILFIGIKVLSVHPYFPFFLHLFFSS